MKTDSGKTRRVIDGLETYYGVAECALNYGTPFELLVAVILSAQCTDKRVNAVTPALFQAFPDAESFAALTEEELIPYIRSCGFYNNKSKNIISAAKSLVEDFGGAVPSDIEDLQRLAGVGRKTANVVYAEAFGGQAIAVDTHVFRVSRRIGLAKPDTKDVFKVERQLMEAVPHNEWTKTHHLLIKHGREICTARKPDCDRCPIKQDCLYFNSRKVDK